MAHLGLAELDAEECFIAVNPMYASMLGLEGSELLGHHWRITVHPEDHSRAQEAYRLARTQGQGYAEIRAVRKNGSPIYQALTASGIKDECGNITGFRCLRHDISPYKREQEALMLAVESAPNGLIMLDASGRIQFVNRCVERLFGYARAELIGRRIEMLLPQRVRAEHVKDRTEFVSSGKVKAIPGRDLSGLRKDGVEIPLQIHLSRVETDHGELVLCTVIDIAERVRYQQQLELAKQAAEAANRAKSDFLARMSHEIRTPMNLILGMNALLLESPLTEKQRQHVEISYRNVRRLLRLINGILDLSKVEAGKFTLEAVPFDLDEVLRECAATMSAAMEQKGLQFDLSVDPDTWRYWIGDAERLQQVLLNLIGNAVKFTEQGRIEVRVRCNRAPDCGPELRFEVTDTGCGVPPDKASMIFEAFQQADGSMNRRYDGTGLGLAIAKHLVGMMSGKIWVEEKTGPGAKFIFTAALPPTTAIAVRERIARTHSSKAAESVVPGTRVLLVEDNAENQFLLRAYLKDLTLSLEFASNGAEALECRSRNTYDLIFMDIQMPVMDGYTATREIRAWEKAHRTAPVPIVALTAHALSSASLESLEAGCNGYLSKPVERNELIEALAKYATRPQAPAQEAPASDPFAALRPAFLANRRADLVRMRNALTAGDFSTIQGIGHDCKGIGSGYGFPDITRIGSMIERAAKTRDATELETSLGQLEEVLAALTPTSA